MFNIGPYKLTGNLLLAPMAGVTDHPFRNLCRHFGAALTTTEMLTSNTRLWHTRKSQQRQVLPSEPEPRSVQIAGYDPDMMAEAARRCVDSGAQIIDINMGCPAKKVCNKAAGSALLRDEWLVAQILDTVVKSTSAPVTLKIRTGWCKDSRNALNIARIAEDSGIQALAIHGRTRACRFQGSAEYDTIATVKQQLAIPVIANGDISSAKKAQFVLDYTGADAIMIGRATQGRPWIFRDISHYLATGSLSKAPTVNQAGKTVVQHVTALHRFYGEHLGVRIARKHFAWYSVQLPRDSQDSNTQNRNTQDRNAQYRKQFNAIDSAAEQLVFLNYLFARLDSSRRLAA